MSGLKDISPAPWWFEAEELLVRAHDGNVVVDADSGDDVEPECSANGRLITAAPDHALVLYALTCGLARWDAVRGDLFVGEQPFATTVDEFGCPKVSPVMRDALVLATGGRR